VVNIGTFCRVGEPACSLVATVDGGELTAVAPDRDHPISRGLTCNKGIAALDVHRGPGSFDPLSNMAYMTRIPVDVQLVG
jgi:predicted molibdopterin-dependent oxidoreductase YjgC